MAMFKIVNTDNFGGDYPDEHFVNLPPMTREAAQEIADTINRHHCNGGYATRYYKVVPSDYALQPGFEP
jgi:hypothetical protein